VKLLLLLLLLEVVLLLGMHHGVAGEPVAVRLVMVVGMVVVVVEVEGVGVVLVVAWAVVGLVPEGVVRRKPGRRHQRAVHGTRPRG